MTIFAISQYSLANSDNSCTSLTAKAEQYFSQLNRTFNKDIQLDWIETVTDYRTGQPRLARLDDATMAEEGHVIHMASLCSPGKEVPSWEAIAFVLSHEFAHFIFDDDAKSLSECMSSAPISEELTHAKPDKNGIIEMDPSVNLWHMNVDIFALKLLNHFNINARKAIKNFQDQNLFNNSNQLEEKQQKARLDYLSGVIPTDFKHSDDFFKVRHFNGVQSVDSFLHANYPASSFLSTILRDTQQYGSCRRFKDEIHLSVPSPEQLNVMHQYLDEPIENSQ